MALKQNIIYIYFKGKHLVTSKSQYQYNHGQFLYFADLDLPQAFEVHFSSRDRGESKTQIGSNKLVEIPDEYFWNGALQIYAWIYLHSQANDGETAKPTDEEPLPVQQSTIDRAIAELNNAVDITTENANKTDSDKIIVSNIKEDVITLKENIDSTATTINQKAQETIDASERAETSAQNAATSERKALDYSQQAEQSAQSALESKNIAQQKSEVAINASNEALGYRNEALEAKNQAEQAKQNIVDYRDETKGYRDETLTAKNHVQTLKNQIDETAEEIKDISDTVNENAQSASQSANSASQSASSASQSASNASQSANSASQSASQAEQFKNQSEANVTHYPKVVNGYWYVWDAVNEEYVNTNVDARGIKGNDGEDGFFIHLPTEIIPIFVDEEGKIKTETVTTGSTVNVFKGNTPINFELSIPSDHVGNLPVSVFKISNTNWNYSITIRKGVVPFSGNKASLFLRFTIEDEIYNKIITLVKIQDGDTGDSGVYIGTEEPTDENINVWIDSDGIADDIVTDVKVNGSSIVSDGVANIPAPLKNIKDDLSDNGSIIEGDLKTVRATGQYSHAEGGGNTASGNYSHAEGGGNTASGVCSHVEGCFTVASGTYSHAEGYKTIASSLNSHAEGCFTTVSGTYGHAEGLYTTANHRSQHVFGEYNIEDSLASSINDRGNYVEIVGNGDYNTHSNARTLDWNGNEKLAGSLTLGLDTQDEVTITALELKALKDDYSSALVALGVI